MTNSQSPQDQELLDDLQKLLQSQVAQGQEQTPITQLLAAAQIDALCLSFMKQREALFTRRQELFPPEVADAPIESDVAWERFMQEAESQRLIDIEIAAIDQRIAKYRAIADQLLNNIQNPSTHIS